MSMWPSPPVRLVPRPFTAKANAALATHRFNLRPAIWLLCLLCVLVAEGVALTHSYLWAVPLLCLLLAAVAVDLPVVPLVGLTLLVRVLTDDQSSSTSRHSGSVNLSALIAGLFIIIAIGLLVRRRQGLGPALLVGFWILLWTAIAVVSHGASTETIREGVREMSVIALAVIVFNAKKVFSVAVVTRIIQLVGVIPAFIATYQLATHTGLNIGGAIRSNGTFTHPNSGAMYFSIATIVSLWRYLDDGRRRTDVLFTALYATSTIATFSLGGLASLLAMLMAFGALRPGSFRLKLGSYFAAGLIVIGFLATPLGAERVAQESSTTLSSAQTRGGANTSLAWRFYKWRTLIPEWERAPLFGQGLGKTVTAEGTSENTSAGKVPHNEYVRYLVETGVVGLVTLLWGIGLLIGALARRRETATARYAGVLGLAIVAGFLVNALAANTFLYTPCAYAAALIIGAVLSCPTNAVTEFERGTRMRRTAHALSAESVPIKG